MGLTAIFNAELGIVETKLTGSVSPGELNEETVQAVALGKAHDCDFFLSDYSEADVEFSSFDVHELPAVQDAEGMDRCAQIAVIVPFSAKGRQLAEFYETVCFNQSWSVRVFRSRESALDWLLDR